MKQSQARILTTHVGRLQRPENITSAMEAHPRGRPTDPAFAATLKAAVADIVRQQAEAGVDIVNDGEFGKLGWNAYLNGRLSGFEQVPAIPKEQAKPRSRERVAYAAFYAELERGGANYYRSPGRDTAPGMRWACTGPIRYSGQEALAQDLDCLKAAIGAVKVEEAFIPSTSPIIAFPVPVRFPTRGHRLGAKTPATPQFLTLRGPYSLKSVSGFVRSSSLIHALR